MIINLHCSPEVESIVGYLKSTGVDVKFTSTIRPGAITNSGKPSYHSVGLACDCAGPSPSRDSDGLARIFGAFQPVEAQLAELIYAGPQVDYNIKNGQRVGKYAQSIHHNHVHVALAKGHFLDPLNTRVAPESDERVNEADRSEDMAEPMDGLSAPDGGVWVLTKDGGVRAYRGAPFHGSYPGLPPALRQGTRTFVNIEPRDDGQPGYMLRSSGGDLYRFPL
jgi:hypothetical protein